MKTKTLSYLVSLLLLVSSTACQPSTETKQTSEKTEENITNIQINSFQTDLLSHLAPEQKEWLKQAKLGAYASHNQDWDEIEAAAKKEGKVVIYSVSSRIFKLKEAFKEKYGVEIVAYDTPSDIQLEELRRSHKQGIYKVDVLYNSDVSGIANEFLPHKLVWNFVPDTVSDGLKANEKNPMLVHRWASRVFIYNSEHYTNGAPIDNLWDLTRPEWKGKFVLPDLIQTATQAHVIQTILEHPEEMAAAYQEEFGEPLIISPELIEISQKMPLLGKPNAATEWLFRLLKNKPVFTESSDEASDDVGYFKESIGITTFSKMRWVKSGKYEWKPAYNLKPVFGVSYPTVLVIADRAPNPNAAKLLIRFMMEEGFQPWNVPGDYAAEQKIMEEQVKKFDIPSFDDLNMWTVDSSYVYDTKYTYITLYRLLQKSQSQ